jgi:hypothetical protein
MKKATLNLLVDTAIGVAFMLSAASGLVFLVPQSGSTVPTVLGLDLLIWSDLHTVASLAMIGGVLLHLVLHVRWITANVRRTLGLDKTLDASSQRHTIPTTKRGLA